MRTSLSILKSHDAMMKHDACPTSSEPACSVLGGVDYAYTVCVVCTCTCACILYWDKVAKQSSFNFYIMWELHNIMLVK